jgi:hypothetical protein
MKLLRAIRKHPRSTAAGIAALVGTALVMSASAASASATHSSVSSGGNGSVSGWVYYPLGVTLSNSTITTVNGTAVNGGCQYSESASGSGAVSSEEIQIAENPSTCTAQFETGTPTNLAADTSAPSGSLSVSVKDSGFASSTVRAPSTSDPKIYQDDQWLDPFGIQVNAQEQWLTWTTGYCNISWSASAKWSWLNDGWAKLEGHGSWGADCSHAFNRAHSAFDNAVFCAIVTGGSGPPTFTYFGYSNPSTIVWDHLKGYYDGTYAWDYTDSKGGGCNSFLHHGHIFTHS